MSKAKKKTRKVNKELNALVKAICKREGKKSQVKVGDVREILKIIRDIYINDVIFDQWIEKELKKVKK